jgi:LemA protein
MTAYIIIGILLVLTFYLISTYNWFQTIKTRIEASIQDIGNQLKRQANLIPNLETSAKAYLKHEKGIYEEITSARKLVNDAGNGKDLTKVEKAASAISNLVPKIQVLVESNPELKSAPVITKLMDELRDTADKLMYARRVVIDLTAEYNIKLVTVPTNLVANLFGFKKEAGITMPDTTNALSVSADEAKDHKVSL